MGKPSRLGVDHENMGTAALNIGASCNSSFKHGVQVANRGHIGIEQTLTSQQQRGDQPTRMSNKVTKKEPQT